MGETTQTYTVPQSGTNDALSTMAMLNNGGFGGQWNNPFMYFIWLYMMRWLSGNEYGNTDSRQLQTLQELMHDNHNQDLVMAGINGNTQAVRDAADRMGVNYQALQNAITSVSQDINNVGSQLGYSQERVINAVSVGDSAVIQAIKDSACSTQKTIIDLGYQNQLNNERQTYQLTNSINSLGNTVERGFCETAYANQSQTCSLQNTIKDTGTINTNAIINKLDQIQNQALIDKIETLREKNSAQAVIINNGQQSAMFNQMINAAVTPINTALCELSKEITSVQGKLPATVTLPYSGAVAVPATVAYNYGYSTSSWG